MLEDFSANVLNIRHNRVSTSNRLLKYNFSKISLPIQLLGVTSYKTLFWASGLCSRSFLEPKIIFLVTSVSVYAGETLGMQNENILDKDITASSFLPGFEAHRGRLHGSSCWMTNQTRDQYFTVRFEKEVNVTGLAVQGSPDMDCWVKTFRLDYFNSNWGRDSKQVHRSIPLF